MTFGFPKVKWLHLIDEVDKSVRCLCQIFSVFNIPKIIKLGQFLADLFQKNKTVDVFWDTGYIAPKSKIESRAHYAPEPAWGYKL